MEVVGTASHPVGWLVIILAIFRIASAVATGANNDTIFTYSSYQGTTLPAPLQVPNVNSSYVTSLQDTDISCSGTGSTAVFGLIVISNTKPDPNSGVDNQGISFSGRCLHKSGLQFVEPKCICLGPASFSTFFQIDATTGNSTNGTSESFQSLAFLMTSDNSTNLAISEGPPSPVGAVVPGHSFSVELDIFDDPVGVVVRVNNTVTPNNARSSTKLLLGEPPSVDNNVHLVVWIEYSYSARVLDVTVAFGDLLDSKPTTPLLSLLDLDLTEVLQDSMYIGFSGSLPSTDTRIFPADANGFSSTPSSNILLWTFNLDGPAPDFLRREDGTLAADPDNAADLAAEEKRKARRRRKNKLIAFYTVSAGLLFLFLTSVIFVLYRRNSRLNALARALAEKYQIEELEQLGRGPQSFKYKVLSAATKSFNSSQLLGSGGFGSVYKGTLLKFRGSQSPTYVAIKRMSATSHQGASEFIAEVKIIGQVQHRNLVRLLGWCHEGGELLLVYDYMPNGSVDQHLFSKSGKDDTSSDHVLTWARRLKIVSGVGTALAYLHEEWEQRVIHRDVKSSNVMLDADFNARLGDFGLARISNHAEAPHSTAVMAGTHGYLAPELGHTLKATEKTDVYSFGAMVLEVATGRRPLLPLDERRTPEEILLVDWVWGLYKEGTILEAADSRLDGAFDRREMVTLLRIGLLCSHPDANQRPTMREVLNIWRGASLFPPLPLTKPVPVFINITRLESIGATESEVDSTPMTPMDDYGQSTLTGVQQFGGRVSTPRIGLRSRSRKSTYTPLPM